MRQLLLVAGGVAGPRDARANSRWTTAVGRAANALVEKDAAETRGRKSAGRAQVSARRCRSVWQGRVRARPEMYARVAREGEKARMRNEESAREKEEVRPPGQRMMWTTRRTRRV